MLTHNWKFGCNVGCISPEMSPNAVGYRFDSLNEHFSNFNLYSGQDVGNYKEYIESLVADSKYQFRVATPMDFNKSITPSASIRSILPFRKARFVNSPGSAKTQPFSNNNSNILFVVEINHLL
jgi:hypothetical protein